MRYILVFLLLVSWEVLSAQSEEFMAEIEQYRTAYKEKFAKGGENSPLTPEQIPSMQFFDANEKFRVSASFELTPKEKPFEIPTSSGKTKPFVKYGIATFHLEDSEYQLAIYKNLRTTRMPMFRDFLFLPFQDDTNGESTYGGGRYIELKVGDIENGKLTIDFNKAYNPYCAYGDGWNCPIPPVENILEVEIAAGEKNFKKK